MSTVDHRPGHMHAKLPDVTLLEYWSAIVSRRWMIAGVTVLVVIIVLVGTLLMTPQFQATTTLQINRDAMNVVNIENLMPTESPMDRDFYETQYELLRSRTLAQEVIRSTHLAEHPAYKELAEKVASQAAEGAEGDKATVRKRQQDAVERALTADVLDGLEIEPVRNSRLAKVHFSSPDPGLSARVANAYASTFISDNLKRQLDASTFAVKYLSERLEQLRGKVEESERALVDYSGDQQIVSVGDNAPSLPAQNLTELNGLLASAQNAKIQAEAAWNEARVGTGLNLPQVVSNPMIQSLREAQAEMQNEYNQKLATYKPDYPEMMRLKSRIDASNRQIQQEIGVIRASLKSQYDTAAQQELLTEQRITGLKHDQLDLEERSIRYNMLKRDVDTNRQLYDALLQRFKEIGVAGNVGANNVSVIDTAEVPGSPYSPRLPINLALGAVFGFFIGLVLALMLHLIGSVRRSHRA
ncbi:GumC family protein [Pseudoxanthomonas sp.]|uniref:GumC family protein n=1 Tax=Pseudoxanthomonas sp. TaxID=1871049 RepID=UPI0026382656|nr:GumC family protein [Pseudoxanthomonas sp.]WDS36301.1 MAG: GumC family protein [Pseudoxanthomonas sp.]